MSVVSTIKRGSAELAILTVLAQEPLHGYEIARRIEQTTGGMLRFQLASLYPTLYRLEKRGWILGSWQDSSSGRPRRCYRLDRGGQEAAAAVAPRVAIVFRGP